MRRPGTSWLVRSADRAIPHSTIRGCGWRLREDDHPRHGVLMNKRPVWCRDVPLLGSDAPLPLDRPFSSKEADSAGVSPRLRRQLVQEGLLRPLLRGVYVATQVPDTFDTRVTALVLVVPSHGIVVDRTAAWAYGVDALPRSAIHTMPPIDVFSREDSRMRRGGIRSGVRQLTERDIDTVKGLRLTTHVRTACDLGRLLWRFDALSVIDGLLRAGLDQDALLHEVERFKGYRGIRQLRHLAPLGDPLAESPPESALRLHWHDADLPWPRCQIWVHGDDGRPRYRIDVGHEETLYGGEYFGEEFHDEDDREDDETRLEWLATQRSWVLDVFRREDVYGRGLRASTRLRVGFELARRQLGVRRAVHLDLGR